MEKRFLYSSIRIILQCKSKGNENFNETLEKVFCHIEKSAKGSESEANFVGLFDNFDVNNNKLGSTLAKRNEKLCKFLDGVANIKNQDIDTFGDAEYLMTMYASNVRNQVASSSLLLMYLNF